MSENRNEPQLTYEQLIQLRAQENEFKKEAHRRHLEYFAMSVVAIGVIVASIGMFTAENDLRHAFNTLLTTIMGAAIGFVLKTRTDHPPMSKHQATRSHLAETGLMGGQPTVRAYITLTNLSEMSKEPTFTLVRDSLPPWPVHCLRELRQLGTDCPRMKARSSFPAHP